MDVGVGVGVSEKKWIVDGGWYELERENRIQIPCQARNDRERGMTSGDTPLLAAGFFI